ncbi:glycosyltransferase [bacterium]|mgnify:FL=1|nr:glycosyltransferase [bacterium]
MNCSKKICAIVVTYNRKDLLLECLQALKKQLLHIDGICVIDNFSSDGTPEALLENKLIDNDALTSLDKIWTKNLVNEKNAVKQKFYYMRSSSNIGGSGGFYEGIKRMSDLEEYDWFWLMDDDTIPYKDASKEIFYSINIAKDNFKSEIGFASSKAMFDKENVHRMNVPQIKSVINNIPFNTLDDKGILLTNSASFVSMMISNDAVKKVGYPIKKFFIYGDDAEYSMRIVNNGFLGIYCKNSVVHHKTKDNRSYDIMNDTVDNLWRYKYSVRNSLVIIRISSKAKFLLNFIYNLTIRNFMIVKNRKNYRIKFVTANTLATLSSVFFITK